MPPLLIAALVGLVGYFGYEEYQKYKTKTVTTPSWLPPIPALTRTYNDYITIQTNPPNPIVVWDINTNQPFKLQGLQSVSISKAENQDVFPTGAGGTIFWMNVNGVANRMYTAFPLA